MTTRMKIQFLNQDFNVLLEISSEPNGYKTCFLKTVLIPQGTNFDSA